MLGQGSVWFRISGVFTSHLFTIPPSSPVQSRSLRRGGFLKLLTATVSLEDYVVVKVDMGSLALETRELAIVAWLDQDQVLFLIFSMIKSYHCFCFFLCFSRFLGAAHLRWSPLHTSRSCRTSSMSCISIITSTPGSEGTTLAETRRALAVPMRMYMYIYWVPVFTPISAQNLMSKLMCHWGKLSKQCK